MSGQILAWRFFDVDTGQLPEAALPSLLPGRGRGRIVALAATPFACSDNWAGRAAVALASQWAKEGLRIFLMDLGLESPMLHQVLGLENEEGVTDAFLYGASVQHIARPALEGSIFFASAGSATADPGSVLGHSRWNDLAGGFSETDAALLLFLPTDIEGAGKILSRASDILFLAAQGESPDAHLGPAAIKMVAMLGPLGAPPEKVEEVVAPAPPLVEEPPAERSAPEPEMPQEEPAELGEEPPATQEEAPTLFGEEFSLAEGFGAGPEEGLELLEPAYPEGLGEEPLFGDDFALEGEVAPEAEGAAAFPGEPPPDFGGELALEDGMPPDFGAEFVGGAIFGEDAPGALEAEGEFGGDLVQGADFGGPSGEFPEVGALEVEPSPPVREVERPAREVSVEEERPVRAPAAPPRRPSPPKKKFPKALVVTLVVVAGLGGAAAATVLGYLNVPGLTFLREYLGELPDPELTLGGPQPVEPPLRYSLVLFTYDQPGLGDARLMLDALRSRLPGLLFTLSPEEAPGGTRYVLMAGSTADRAGTEGLRGDLAQVLTREDPGRWAVRETPRAFFLGERETLDQALEYLDSVEDEGISAYVLRVSYRDGGEGYQILSGAFEGVQEARTLQRILWRAGFRDAPLIERRGSLPE